MVTAVLDDGARSALDTTRFTDVRWFGEIDSTNRYLLDEARAGAPEGLVAVADHQTAGRGRLGRSWVAPAASSLLVSILLRPSLAAGQLHLVNVSVGLAAADACGSVAKVEPGLKWPNDLLVDGRKLAGVLAEAVLPGPRAIGGPGPGGPGPGGGPGGPAVVVGAGINVNWPDELPEKLVGAAVSLNHLAGRPVDRARLLVALLRSLEERLTVLAEPGGPRALMSEYRRRCATIGSAVRVDLADESFTGVATDLSDEGHLLVNTDACLRTVSAGDVVHLRPA